MLLPDGDEVEAIAPSHVPLMDFFGNCCQNAGTPTPPRIALVHHANCRTFATCVPRWFCQFLLERLAMWPREHTSSPADGSQDIIGEPISRRRALRSEPRAMPRLRRV